MSDVSYKIQLPGARLESLDQQADSITLHFSQVHLVQQMENAFEDSLWTQAVSLTVKGATLEGELPACPCEITGGDMTDNIYTYRDFAPLPIDWHGDVRCRFSVAEPDASFTITGESIQLEQHGHPRYIKHIKKI